MRVGLCWFYGEAGEKEREREKETEEWKKKAQLVQDALSVIIC